MIRGIVGVLVIAALVWLSIKLTNWLDRRRALPPLTLETERTDPTLTILAKRRAERARQRLFSPGDFE